MHPARGELLFFSVGNEGRLSQETAVQSTLPRPSTNPLIVCEGESEQAYFDAATEVTDNRGRNPKRPGRLGTNLDRGIC